MSERVCVCVCVINDQALSFTFSAGAVCVKVTAGVNIGTCFLRLWTSVDVVFNYVVFAYTHMYVYNWTCVRVCV